MSHETFIRTLEDGTHQPYCACGWDGNATEEPDEEGAKSQIAYHLERVDIDKAEADSNA